MSNKRVYCSNKECRHREKGTGRCMSDTVYLDGRYCSGFGFDKTGIALIESDDGYEGFIALRKGFTESEDFFNLRCPKCGGVTTRVTSNLYKCVEGGSECDVKSFRVAPDGSIYNLRVRLHERPSSVKDKKELDEIIDRTSGGKRW